MAKLRLYWSVLGVINQFLLIFERIIASELFALQ